MFLDNLKILNLSVIKKIERKISKKDNLIITLLKIFHLNI